MILKKLRLWLASRASLVAALDDLHRQLQLFVSLTGKPPGVTVQEHLRHLVEVADSKAPIDVIRRYMERKGKLPTRLDDKLSKMQAPERAAYTSSAERILNDQVFRDVVEHVMAVGLEGAGLEADSWDTSLVQRGKAGGAIDVESKMAEIAGESVDKRREAAQTLKDAGLGELIPKNL